MLTAPTTVDDANQLIDDALALAMYATRCAVSRTLGTSPGALVYKRDMFIDVPLMADLVQIQERRQ